jgi:hypothetical protein
MVPLTDVVAGLIKTQGFHSRMVEFSLQQHWGAIVGAPIAGHTFPEAIRHRKLFLLAENSVWLQQLLFLKAELLTKIASAMGDGILTDIVLRVGIIPHAIPPCDQQPDESERSIIGPDLSACIEESVRGIPQEGLLERLRALFIRSATNCAVTSSRVPSEKELYRFPQTTPRVLFGSLASADKYPVSSVGTLLWTQGHQRDIPAEPIPRPSRDFPEHR